MLGYHMINELATCHHSWKYCLMTLAQLSILPLVHLQSSVSEPWQAFDPVEQLDEVNER